MKYITAIGLGIYCIVGVFMGLVYWKKFGGPKSV